MLCGITDVDLMAWLMAWNEMAWLMAWNAMAWLMAWNEMAWPKECKDFLNKDAPRSKNSLLFAALGFQWCQLAVVSSAVSDAWLKNAFVFALAKVWQTLIGPGQQWFWPQTVKVWLVVLICCDSNSLCFWYVWIQSHCFDSKFQTQTQCFGCWLSADSIDLSLILLSLMLNELSQTQAQWSYIYMYVYIFSCNVRIKNYINYKSGDGTVEV